MHSKRIQYSLVLWLGISTLGLVGCGGGEGDSARLAQTIDASKNGVIATEIATNEGYVHISGTTQFNLIGVDKDGEETNLNDKATWKTSDPALATVKNGLVTATGSKGEIILSADYAGIHQEQAVVVTDANLLSISIDQGTTSGDECKNTTFTATAHFEGDLELEYPLTWAITEGTSLASFIDPAKGIMSTKNSGAVKVVAQGKNNSGTLITSPPLDFTINDTLASLSVTSNKAAEMREGDVATISVTGTYSPANTTADIASNSTLSAVPANAIKFEGTKITAQNGSHAGVDVILTGSCGGVKDDLELVVKEKELKSIEIKNSSGVAENLSISEGNEMDLNITATYIDDTTDPNYTYQVKWEIDEEQSDNFDDDMITIDQNGKVMVDDDLNLLLQINIVVVAEVLDEDDSVATNASGQDLTDEVTITVKPN